MYWNDIEIRPYYTSSHKNWSLNTKKGSTIHTKHFGKKEEDVLLHFYEVHEACFLNFSIKPTVSACPRTKSLLGEFNVAVFGTPYCTIGNEVSYEKCHISQVNCAKENASSPG